ncbi:MAG: AlbA family DNA-binding domain-containing protein, partial [Candidatus Thorarchaeota archaeon]
MEQFNSSLERHAKTNERTLGTLRNWAKKLALTERPSTLLLALSMREKEWRLAYGELVFGLSLEEEVDWAWPEFRLIHRQIDSKDGLKLLDDLCTTGYLNLSDSDRISAPGNFTKAYRPSDSANQYLKVDWPIRTFEFDTENIFLGDMSGEDLTGKDLPYFPDSKTALYSRTIQSISERSHRMDLFRQGRLNAYLIDNRARFSHVRVDSNGIKAQVEWGTLSDETAETKAYVESPDDGIQALTVEPGKEGYHIPIGEFPQRFDIAIITDSGDLVDWRHFMPYYDWGYEGVEVEIPAYEVTMMALQGESDVLEYKSGAYKEIRDDILESVVAFANRHGGTILIGVDDHGRILGLD